MLRAALFSRSVKFVAGIRVLKYTKHLYIERKYTYVQAYIHM